MNIETYKEKIESKKERLLARSEKLKAEGEARWESGAARLRAIPFGQPILVGHHSERSDRSYRAKANRAMEKGHELTSYAEHLEERAERIGTGGISSENPEAIRLLQEKLEGLLIRRKGIVETNAIARKEKRPRVYQPYHLANLSGNIRSVKERIATLQKIESAPEVGPITGPGYTCEENKEEARIMFTFEGKPKEEVRSILKHHAFKWSPTRGAWVRQITPNAQYATKQVIKIFNETQICL
jgi:hypothetical protein